MKMIKKTLPLFFQAVTCLAPATLHAQTNPRHELLWEITVPGNNQRSYLYGTFHVRDRRAFHFTDSTLIALESCSYFALELDPDSLLGMLMGEFTGEESGSNLPVGKADIRLSRFWDEWDVEKIREQEMDEKEQHDYPTFVDLYLYEIARYNGKKTLGVEKTQAQSGLIDKIHEGSTAYPRGRLFADMISAYEKGDIHTLGAIMSKSDEYTREKVIRERNHAMADSISRLVISHRSFIAVGAGHLPGNEGVVELLRKKGFGMRPVTATWTGYLDKYKDFGGNLNWEEYSIHKGTLHVKVPHKPLDINLLETADFSFTMDLFRETYYMSFYTPYYEGLEEQARLKLLNDAKERIIARLTNLSAEQTGITPEGHPYIELHFDEPIGTYWVRMVATDFGLTVLMTGTSRSWTDNDSELASTYFESATFHAPIEKGDKEFYDEHAGLRFTLPSHTQKKVNKEVLNEEENQYVITTMYTCTDVSRQRTIIIGYYEYPQELVEGQSSTFLTRLAEYVKENYLTGKETRTDTLVKQGFSGISVSGYNRAERIYMRTIYFMRGNRPYFIMVTAPEKKELDDEKISEVIEGVQFTDYRVYDWEQYTDTAAGYSLLIPSPMEPDEPLRSLGIFFFLQESNDSSVIWKMADTCSRYTYRFNRSWLSSYTCVPDADSLLRNQLDEYMQPGDTILSSQYYTRGGMRSCEYILQEKDSPQKGFVKLSLWGNQVLAQYVRAEDNESVRTNVQRYFGSLSCREAAPFDISGSKTGLLLSDCFSSDSVVRENALDHLVKYPFTDHDFSAVVTAIETAAPDDISYKSKSALLGITDKFSDSLALPFMRRFYTQPDAAQYQMDIIEALAGRETAASIRLMGECLQQAIPDTKNYFPLALALQMSDSSMKNLVPYLVQLAGNPQLTNLPVLPIFRIAADSGWVSRQSLQPVFPQLYTYCTRLIEERKQENQSGSYFYNYRYVPDLLDMIGDQQSIRLLHKMAGSEHTSTAMDALVFLLKRNEKVPGKLLKSYAEDPGMRLDFFRQLDASHRTDLIPPQFNTQQKIAEAILVDYVSWDQTAPDELVFLQTYTSEKPGKEGLYYIFSFSWKTQEKGEPQEWYIGMTGPMPADGKTINFNATANTLYEPLESRGIDQHIKAMLQSE